MIKLKTLRKNGNLTQEKLAKELGVSKSIIGLIEAKRMMPYPKIKQQIAEFFGLNVSDIKF